MDVLERRRRAVRPDKSTFLQPGDQEYETALGEGGSVMGHGSAPKSPVGWETHIKVQRWDMVRPRRAQCDGFGKPTWSSSCTGFGFPKSSRNGLTRAVMDDPKQVSLGIYTESRTCCPGHTLQEGYVKEFLQLRKTAVTSGRGQ